MPPDFDSNFVEQSTRGVDVTGGDNFVSKLDEFAPEFMLRIRIGLSARLSLEELLLTR